ncbi:MULTISPECIES: DctP family TRAP transporter solute-binding subunit [Dethiosulfovibrio]|uniref:DctP family TRAP transporter solute-binding subunit n=2 Tax=Dethiosulfovibrio TaxID=47054 RepID=A0ABS9ES19_9BACT|nr:MULTISPECIES: DctP family TRAP transporter solute-binding subunit [Dethiosulfovibrio]MCF4114387.1 DctP family TRAP transporter solute-binding subunit [Dethiosulfovibrio russensis]MCF4142952.1 DctP family TRAP transporter solute-binding subunit [Dethiosulfovibrio marinus]MCF4145049.1 DctP family TRAP transporter solute-binding subunit [Dethiosulfovibrio acidaminovorans]
MNVRIRTTLCLAVTAVILAMPVSSAVADNIKLSNQLPPSHHISKALDFFADKVKEYSGGKTTVKVFHSAQLFKDTEVVEALQENLVPIALVPVNKWSGMIPATDVFEMPFVFEELDSIKKFIEAGAGELLNEEFKKKGVADLFWADYGFVQFFNSKRPLVTPADFEGLKIRTFSNGTAETVSALGGTPVVMSSSEMYMALQRKTVDGATTGMPAAVSRKIFEVQNYLTVCNYTTAQFVIQCNLEWWDELGKDEKEMLQKAGAEAEAWLRGQIAQSEKDAQKVIADAGLEITVLNADQRKAFVEATEPVRSGFMEKTPLCKKLVEIALGSN